MKNLIKPGFEILPSDTLLDVGCGRGDMCVRAGTVGAAVIAIDVLDATLKLVEARMKDVPARSFKSVVSDCRPIPLASSTVSAVIAQEVIEHVDEPLAFLSELYRVGTPDARYLITMPDAASENVMRLVARPEYFQKPNHIHVFQRNEMKSILSKAGFKIIWEGLEGFYWSLWWIFHEAQNNTTEVKEKKQEGNIWDESLYSNNKLTKLWEDTYRAFQGTPKYVQVEQALSQLIPKSQIYVVAKSS